MNVTFTLGNVYANVSVEATCSRFLLMRLPIHLSARLLSYLSFRHPCNACEVPIDRAPWSVRGSGTIIDNKTIGGFSDLVFRVRHECQFLTTRHHNFDDHLSNIIRSFTHHHVLCAYNRPQ